MKKVYMIYFDASFDGEDWFTEDVSSRYYYLSEKEANDIVIDYESFDWTYSYLEEHNSACAYLDTTLFMRRPVIAFREPGTCSTLRMTKNNFHPFKERVRHKEVKACSMYELMNRLGAGDFIEFCKDHGLNTCPVQEST